jgi:SNF2 family DNA or RNA helicase
MAGVQLSSDFETAIPLRSYQKVVPEIVLTQGFLLLADDLGLGKTAAGIGLLTRGLARPALVVTATALTLQWQRELARFAPSLTSHILTKGSVYDLTTHGKKRHPRQTTIISQMPDVVICNYAKLAGWAEHLSQIMTTVIYDEAQELRRSDSQSTRQRVASPRSADTE